MVKFMYNGVKVNNALYKAYYSLGNLINQPETITIYSKNYSRLPVIEGLTTQNDTDITTDYFENDRIRVIPNNPNYKSVYEAYLKQEEHILKKNNKRMKI